MSRRLITIMGMLVTLLPTAAHADWLFTPAWGTTFGRDTHGREHTMFGGAVGGVDYEPFGWELDFSFAPDFFEGHHRAFDFKGNSHVGTLMINGVLGDLSAIRETTGLRPYVTVGIGVIQVRAVTEGARGRVDTWVHEAGFNAGGGVVLFLGSRIGLRADVRYIRSFQDDEPSWTYDDSTFDVAPGKFDFFRSTVGITFRLPPEGTFTPR